MDLHLPKSPIRSVKDFLIHIGTVTIGILIALSLGQIFEARQHRQLAAAAVAGFRKELAFDRMQVTEVLGNQTILREKTKIEIARLESGEPHEIANVPMAFNNLVTASWETAVATQALNYLPYDQVRDFAEAFDVFRLFNEQERQGLVQWQELDRFGRDSAKLSPTQRTQLIELLRHYEIHSRLVEKIGQEALKLTEGLVTAP